MLEEIGAFLVECGKHLKLKLIVVSSICPTFKGLYIEHHLYDDNTFFNLLESSDLGIYALDNSVISKGKMAMKILDYGAAGLPILATKYGVSSHLKNNENVIFCNSKKDWIKNIIKIK